MPRRLGNILVGLSNPSSWLPWLALFISSLLVSLYLSPAPLSQGGVRFALPDQQTAPVAFTVADSGIEVSLDAGESASYPGTGTTWTNLVTGGPNATLTDVTFDATGKYLSFNGTSSGVVVDGYSLPTIAYTKVIWFRLSSYGVSNLISSSSSGHVLWVDSNGYVNAGHGSSISALKSSSQIALNTWYMVSVTYDSAQSGTDIGKLYIDGSLATSASLDNVPANSSVNIGTGGGGFRMTGDVGELYIYGSALAAADISTIYTNTSAEYPNPLPDTTAPTLISSSPVDNAVRVSETASISLNFDEAVTLAAGKEIEVRKSSDDSVVESFGIADVSGAGTSQLVLQPIANWPLNTELYVFVDSTTIEDQAGNSFSGLASGVLSFTVSKVPLNGLTVALDASDADSYSTPGYWLDLSGNDNDVKLYASPQRVTDGPNAFNFVATSSQFGEFVDRDNSDAKILNLLNRTSYTKVVWFKPGAFGNNNNLFSASSKAAHALWGSGPNVGTNKPCGTLPGANLASAHNSENGWGTVFSSECVEQNQWQLVAVSFDSDDGWRLYRNGVEVGSSSNTSQILDSNLEYATRIASYSTGNFFNGEIARVYLYERDLTVGEVNAIFDASVAEFGLNLKTVTLDPQGGSVAFTSLRSQVDGTVALPTPTKENAVFLGWFTDSVGGEQVVETAGRYTAPSDITLYARWDASYTVSYSPGRNATGAPGSASFLTSTGPLTLPTPEREDYVFDGWFTADTGGQKVGDAGDSFTPESDITLHGRWTQASLAGIDPADLTEVGTATTVATFASTISWQGQGYSVSVTVPADALPPGSVVKIYSIANNNRAQQILTSESNFVTSLVVAWTASDTTVPVATSALTMVIVDSSIKAGAKVYSIVGDTSTLLATATQDGRVTVSFTTDPLVAIANPTVTSGSGGSSGGGTGGGAGGGSGSSGGGSVPVVTQPPVVSEPGVKKELDNKPVIPELVNGRPTQSVLVDGQPSQIEIREIQSSTALEVEGDDWRLEISARSSTGIQRPVADSTIRLLTGDRAVFSGTGMAPNTIFNVYVFSDPELIGQISTNEDGEFSADLPLPADLPLGPHTLQLGSLSATGETITVSVPIEISGKVNAGSFKGVVALYAKGFLGKRLSAKLGNNWVVVDRITKDFVRIIEPTRKRNQTLAIKIYVDRQLVSTVNLVTK